MSRSTIETAAYINFSYLKIILYLNKIKLFEINILPLYTQTAGRALLNAIGETDSHTGLSWLKSSLSTDLSLAFVSYPPIMYNLFPIATDAAYLRFLVKDFQNREK